MKYLRSAADYTRKDPIENTKIREELNILNVNDETIKSSSRWKYHVLRMEDRRISKKVLTCNPKRRRNVGCPQLRWRDQHIIQEDGTGHA
jgi:hypothetical protein